MRRFTPLARHRSVLVRLVLGASLAAALAISTIQAQIPGRNVNMVSGTRLPEGDPFLQRQNEPSIAASTRNPLHLLGGSNDYRTVDVPGMCLEYGPDPDNPGSQICVKTEEVTGDAWLGLFKSTDGGQRWTSGLLPGYPQDGSPAGLASPLHARPGVPNSGYQAGADAVVRAGTNGLIYYSGLAFDRADNGKSGVFLARFIDNNNQEAGDPVAYLGTTMVAQSSGAKFLDKPWMAVDIPRSNAAMCTITADNILPTQQNGRRRKHGYDRDERHDNDHERDDDHRGRNGRNDRDDDRRDHGRGGRPSPKPPKPPKPMVQRIPAGAIYVAYSSITGDGANLRSEILLTRSMDCGNTWSAPIKVSRPEDAINQGSSLTIDPRTGAVYVGWRRFDPDLTDTNDLDGIMVARLPFGASKIDPPSRAHKFPKPTRKVGRQLHRLFEHRENRFKNAKANEATENLDQFDLGTTGYNFRTNAYPTMAADGTGRVYIAWTQRGFAANPTISNGTVVSSGLADGARIVIATTRDGRNFTAPAPVDDHDTPGRGHQLMPSMAFAGGKLMLVFYDLRDSKAQTHNRISSDFNTNTGLRQTIDIRSAMATPGDSPVFAPSVKVSDYLMGFNPESGEIEELQVNPPNLPMFKQGTVPFIGDYIDVTAAPAFIPAKNGKWEFNTANTGAIPVFHAAWTDNRDVRPPKNGEWWNYTPAKMSPDQVAGASGYDPSQNTLQCVDGIGNPGSRNQNVYSARITGGLLAGSPGNAKPLSPELQRGFVVFAQNTTRDTRSYRMTILSQPVGGRASFDQFPLPPYTSSSPAPETAIEMIVPPLSTASRTVYVTSTDANAQLTVDVSELNDLRLLASPALYPSAAEKTAGLEARVVLNPDIENPDIENPDIENPDIENPDIENVEVYNPDIENPDIENPDIENPDIENPDIENPDIENPDIENPDIENVRVANPDIENPDIENPDIENPDIENPDIENPDIENPDIENGAIADITWKVSNTGNTTASFNVNLFLAQQTLPTGVKTQLVLLKTYRTPVTQANKCQLGFQTRNILLANIRNPILVPPGGGTSNANDPAETNATLWLAPGEEGRIVLRVIDEDTSNNVPVTKPNGDVEYIDPSMLPSEDVSPVVQQQAVNSDDAEGGVTVPPVVPPPPPPATDDVAWTSANTPVTINVLGNDAALFGSTKIITTHPAGTAQNMGGSANELVYMPTTGLLYAGSGRTVGIIDPVTNHLVGRMPIDPTDPAATYGLGSATSGLVFFRMGDNGQPNASLYAYDARPGSPTLHQVLQISPTVIAAIDALHDAFTFTLDTTGKTLFYVAGNQTPGIGGNATSTLSAINADPASPAIGTIMASVAMPANVRVFHLAQNPVTGKVYLAAMNQGSANGGVYMWNPATPAVAPVKIAGTDQSHSLAINPATNLIFAAGTNLGNYRLNTVDGATDTLLGQVEAPGSDTPRTFNTEDRLVTHYASGKVYLRSRLQVLVFNGDKGSATFNTLLTALPVGPDFNQTDLVVNQSTGVVATAGNFYHSVSLIDVATNTVTPVPLPRAGGELAVDPTSTRLFAADFLNSVHRIDTSVPVVASALSVFPETATVVGNPAFNRAYVAMADQFSTISSFSGAGPVGPVTGLGPLGVGRWGFGGRLNATNTFFFVNSAADVTGTQSRPGVLATVNGSTDSVAGVVDTVGQPFGMGVNQAMAQVIVAGLNGVNAAGTPEAGKIRIHDAGTPTTFADANLTGVPVTGPTAVAFGRHVVTDPNTGGTYVMVIGGSPVSLVYLPPTTLPTAPVAQPITLPASVGGVTFNANDRVEVIRTMQVSPGNSLVYLGTFNGSAYKVAVLDGNTRAAVAAYAGGGHSRVHTASWLAVNAATNSLYVVDYNADTLTKLNATSLTYVGSVTLPGGPSAMALDLTRNRVYVSSINNKTLTAIDGASLAVLSSVQLPLHAFFLSVNEPEGRIYTSGGNSSDESGVMVISDVAGQLGAAVNVTSATNGGGTTTVNADNSITYTPGPTTVGTDTFTYTAHTAAGDSVATVTVNVVPVAAAPVAFSDAYSTPVGVTLNVGGRGVLANDAVSNTATASQVAGLPGLTLNGDGSFAYAPTGTGTFQFQYLALDGANSNVATVTINVIAPANPLIVVNTANSGTGSLRAAMDYANTTPGPQTITFAIPDVTPATPAVINLQTSLPLITESVTIDGLTQSNGGLPLIEVTNNGGGGIPIGFETNTDVNSVTIRGLAITRFQSHGIRLMQADASADGTGHVIEGNYIGTDPNGTTGKGNAIGIEVRRDDAQILNNVIAGNTGPGILVSNDTDDAVIVGNLIGVSPVTGLALGNSSGIRMYDYGSGVIIDSNTIAGNTSVGIDIQNNQPIAVPGVTGTRIIGNTIGLNLSGARVPNGAAGVRVDNGPNTRVGEPGLGNVISGNTGVGVLFTGAPSPGARVQGNLVGTNAAGDAPLGNTGAGVVISVSGIDVGWTPGDGPNAANLISGNGGDGVRLLGATNRVRGNLIGTNKAGTAALGSDVGTPSLTLSNFQGIYITGAGNTVGGGLAAERNVLSGNRIDGVFVETPTGNNNLIMGNYIGTDQSGATSVANGWDGVGLIALPASSVTANSVVNNVIAGNALRALYITSSGNTIDGNRIGLPPIGVTATGPLGNLGGGVVAPLGTGNRILANAINNNTGLGIDLAGGGVTVNNPSDGILDFPTLGSAHNGGPTTAVDYSLPPGGFAPGGYTLRFFSSSTCDASGYGEGETLRHVVNAAGGSTATATFASVVPTGEVITVTAEDAAGNTSEFSACRVVLAAAPPPATITSVQPNPSAPGYGQFVYIRGTNLPGVTPADVILSTGTGDVAANNIWHMSPTLVVARFYLGPVNPTGPGTIRVKSPDNTIVSNSFPITLSATPGAPILTAVTATCSGGGFLSSANAGGSIWISAEGIDTSGVTVVFTPTSPAGAPISMPVVTTSSCQPGAMSVAVNVPDFMSLSNTQVNVQLQTQVNGITSPLSPPHSMTVTSSLSLAGPAGDLTGAPYGPLYCPAGTSGVGFTVHAAQTYALTSANLRCSDGSTTPKFGGGTIPDATVACNPGDVMVGMKGTIGQPFATTDMPTSVAPRCQAASLTGPVTEPAAPLPGGGASFGNIDCPAGMRVVGVQGGWGAVVDHIYLVCGTP